MFGIRSSQFSRFKSQLGLVYAYPIPNAQEKREKGDSTLLFPAMTMCHRHCRLGMALFLKNKL